MLTALCIGLLSLCAVNTLAAIENNVHLIHERAHSRHPRWEKTTQLSRGDGEFLMRIALAQRNLHNSEDFLTQVSSPSSSTFGQYWTLDKVTDMFALSAESLAAVTSWLTNSGIPRNTMILSLNRGFVAFNITIADAERLLQTRYLVYSDTLFGERSIACDHYSVLKDIRPHIDFITPTIALNTGSQKRRRDVEQPEHVKNILPLRPKLGVTYKPLQLPLDELSNCDSVTTPDCLRALYGIPIGSTANPHNSFGIYAQSPD
jgi:tripeptidyl-peptidase-1